MSEFRKPRLWSDFDGTAVELVGKTNWRNWSKYPLAAIAGYVDFLRGVQAGGVEIAGIVSRRPNIAPRRVATMRSIAELGLDRYFPGRHEVVLTGSEKRKAQFVAMEGHLETTGMIDDKPHTFGPELVKCMGILANRGGNTEVTLGVVSHRKTPRYMAQFAEIAGTSQFVKEVTGDESKLYIGGAGFTVMATVLEPYSAEAGEAFAAQLYEVHRPRERYQ